MSVHPIALLAPTVCLVFKFGRSGTPPPGRKGRLSFTYSVAPICQGTNSRSPRPWASDFVFWPEATSSQY